MCGIICSENIIDVHLFGIGNQKIENEVKYDMKIMDETFEKCKLYKVVIPERLDLYKVDLVSLLDID